MKKLLIYIYCLLLTSCSLFQTTPDAVIKGQRAVYQSILVNEAIAHRVIDTYVLHCKKLVMYHANYVFQLKLDEISKQEEREWGLSKTEQKRAAEVNKNAEIDKAFKSLQVKANAMRMQIKKNHAISLRLVGAIYNYLSTSPIELDNMEFWVNKLDQIAKAEDNE